ncbi:hypothetical protein [Pedobacter yonginense]|uniref:hypothetical protein n=1 Tax=Pedobacter yonginense TaxID=651869 RepID=UPI00105786A1|nr:hypothetical protein [Pedobacter yonginense]
MLFLGIALLLFQYACKKDSSKQSDVELIQQAKIWFDRQPPVTYSPDWDSATVTRLNNRNFVILPSNLSISESEIITQSYLVVDISLKETKGNLIELFNNSSFDVGNTKEQIISNYLFYFDKVSLPRDLDFNIMVFDIDHKFIKGSNIIKGRFKNELNLVKFKDLKSQMLMRGGDEVGFGKQQCTDWYLVTRINGIEISSTYLYTTCTGGGGGGGNGKGNRVSKQKEIINNISDPCLKNTITEALATNKDVKGFLSEIINKFSGNDVGVRVILYNGDIAKPAKTDPSFGSDGRFTAAITFQNGFYDDVSKEAVVAALIHEFVHAYLVQTNNNYRALPASEQHNYLFANFVKDIANYLKSKYNMPKADAWGLAWSGMGDVINKADDNTSFPTEPGETMTKSELATNMAPYKYIDKNAGAKGTPNCPTK